MDARGLPVTLSRHLEEVADSPLNLGALRQIRYAGYVDIFTHAAPRGIPILQTAPQIAAVVNRSRVYLEGCPIP